MSKRKKHSNKKTFFAKSYYDYLRASHEARLIITAWAKVDTEDNKGELISGHQKLLEMDNELIFHLGYAITNLLDVRGPIYSANAAEALNPITSILDAIYTSVHMIGGEWLQGWNTGRTNGDTSLETHGCQCIAEEALQISALYETIRNCVKFHIDAENPSIRSSSYPDDKTSRMSFAWHSNKKLQQDIENERFLKQSLYARLPFPAIFVDHPAAAFLAVEVALDEVNRVDYSDTYSSSNPTHIIVIPLDKGEKINALPIRLLIPIDTEVTIGKTAYEFRPTKDRSEAPRFSSKWHQRKDNEFYEGPNEETIVLAVPGINASTEYDDFFEEFFMHTFNSGSFKTPSFPLAMDKFLIELYTRGTKSGNEVIGVSFNALQSGALETYNLFWTFMRMQQLQGDRINKKTFGIIKPKMMANKKLKKKERPLVEFHTLQIELEREVNVTDFPTSQIRNKPKWHRVKGHLREYKEPIKSGPNKGKTIVFIRSCSKGDADEGVIISDYNLTEEHKPEEPIPNE